MPATSPRSKHTLTKEESIKGGKTSKRGVSIKAQWERILAGQVHPALKPILESKAFYDVKNQKNESAPIKAKDMLEAFALVGLQRAVDNSDQAYKLVQQAIDGAPKQAVEMSGSLDLTGADEKTKKFIEKFGLLDRHK